MKACTDPLPENTVHFLSASILEIKRLKKEKKKRMLRHDIMANSQMKNKTTTISSNFNFVQ